MKQNLYFIFIVVFLSISNICQSQNLIPNPSFEEIDSCPPDKPHQKFVFCKGWWQPTTGTPDLLTPCNTGSYSVPFNLAGYCTPLSGTSYVGMLLYSVYGLSKKEYREYLETKLLEPMVAGKTYKIFFYVKAAGGLGGSLSCYCNSFGMYFSERSIKADSFGVLNYKPQITNQYRMMEDTANWQVVSGEYTAKGGERFLTIGNFRRNKDTKTKYIQTKRPAHINEDYKSSYYYIDNIYSVENSKLKDVETEISTFDELPNIPIWIGRVVPLKNLYFSFDKANLNKSSTEELDKLVSLMTLYKRIHIKIIGYADTIGNNEYNLNLSLNRANIVKKYLIENGIKERRIEIEAKGDTKPINDNKTEEKRKINRRVEIIIRKC